MKKSGWKSVELELGGGAIVDAAESSIESREPLATCVMKEAHRFASLMVSSEEN